MFLVNSNSHSNVPLLLRMDIAIICDNSWISCNYPILIDICKRGLSGIKPVSQKAPPGTGRKTPGERAIRS